MVWKLKWCFLLILLLLLRADPILSDLEVGDQNSKSQNSFIILEHNAQNYSFLSNNLETTPDAKYNIFTFFTNTRLKQNTAGYKSKNTSSRIPLYLFKCEFII